MAATSYTVGGLFGFLFGIPKVPEGPANGLALRSNTNLEQVSDWVTKIVVGVTLVQFGELNRYFLMFRDTIDDAYGVVGLDVTACIMLVLAGVGGFLHLFLVTRSSLLFDETERERDKFKRDKQAVTDAVRGPLKGKDGEPAPELRAQAERLVATVSPASSDPTSLEALGSANLLLRNATAATSAFDKAAELAPDRAGARSAQLGSMLAALYKRKPQSFTEALALGETLLKDPRAAESARLWYYLAIAYSQQYEYLSRRKATKAELADLRDKALDAMKRTLDFDQEYDANFAMLLDADSEDNDMSVFGEDRDFLALLGEA